MKQDFMNCLDVFDEQSSELVKQTIVVHSERTTPFCEQYHEDNPQAVLTKSSGCHVHF